MASENRPGLERRLLLYALALLVLAAGMVAGTIRHVPSAWIVPPGSVLLVVIAYCAGRDIIRAGPPW